VLEDQAAAAEGKRMAVAGNAEWSLLSASSVSAAATRHPRDGEAIGTMDE
jgi:hypothetical protein